MTTPQFLIDLMFIASERRKSKNMIDKALATELSRISQAFEDALEEANRRAEQAEALRDFAIEELERAANVHLKHLARISELERLIPVAIETQPAPESELEKLE